MNKTDTALLVLLVSLLAVAGCARNGDAEPEADAFKTVYSGSLDEGDAVVSLTPAGIIDGKLRVDVGVNTHSISLEQFDLTKITTLEYGGKSLKPESAPALSGHHTSGTLVFGVGEKEPLSSFRITIRGIPKAGERVFEWG